MKVYKSKFGYSILIFITLIFGIIASTLLFNNTPLKEFLPLGGIFLLIYAFYFHLTFTTQYIIDGGILIVKCGFLYHKQYDITKIKSISKTSNLIKSPAPSVDRIELTYGKYDAIIISPKDKISFANELIRINPEIENNLIG